MIVDHSKAGYNVFTVTLVSPGRNLLEESKENLK